MSDDATVRFGYDGTALNAGLNAQEKRLENSAKKTESRFKRLSGELKNSFGGLLPTLGVAGALGGIKSFTNSMDDLLDTSLRLGESAEMIQKVEYASKLLASVDAEGLTSDFLRLEKSLGDVGNEKATQALANLGLTAEGLMRMPLDKKMLALAEAFTNARATGTGYNDIVSLIGKSAGDLIPLLVAGKDAIEGLFAEAHIIPDEEVQRMADINDKLDGFFMRLKSGAATSIPVVEDVVGTLGEAGAAIGIFFKELIDTGSIEKAWDFVGDIDKFRNELAATAEKEAAASKAEAEAARQKTRDLAAEATEVRRLKKEIEDKGKAEKKAASESAALEKRRTNIDHEKQSVELLEAKAKGRDRQAEKMEDEAFVRDRSQALQDKGMDPNRAIALAQRELKARKNLEEYEKTGRVHIGGVTKKTMMGDTFHGLDQFHRNQEKEYETTDPARPGYKRGMPRPKYDAFGRDSAPLTSAQRSGRYMGGERAGTRDYSQTETYKTAQSKNEAANSGSGGVASKIDKSNEHLSTIAAALA